MKEAGERRRIATSKIVRWLHSVSGQFDLDLLRKNVNDHLSTVRAAEPIEVPALRRPRPAGQGDYSVVAVDGSQIELDPHAPVYCFLLNYGVAILRYQTDFQGDSAAWLFSRTDLHYRPEDLVLEVAGRPIALDGQLLGIRRQLGEMKLLARLAADDVRLAAPKLALQDGAMRLSVLDGAGVNQSLRDEFTHRHLQALDQLRESEVPVASYVSRPRSDDVVRALRLWLRKFGPIAADQKSIELADEDFEGTYDRDVFKEVLTDEGDRSAVFCSSWRTSRDQYREHRVHFVYLNTGDEIARVDLPEWVADDGAALDLVHGAIVDQIEKGLGYPVSLTEAHEQAVVRSADRRLFWEVVERTAREAGLSTLQSAKATSKSIRPV